jgi:hypothetical protein
VQKQIYLKELILTFRYCTYAYRNAVGLYPGKQTGKNDSVRHIIGKEEDVI